MVDAIPESAMSELTPVFGARHRHPRPVRLWATNGVNGPIRNTEADARLPKPGAGDTPQGQDRWHAALEFNKLAHLAELVTTDAYELPSHVCGNWYFDCNAIDPFQLEALAIVGHGGPGLLDVDARLSRPSDGEDSILQTMSGYLTAHTLRSGEYDDAIRKIGTRLHDNSVVYLLGCRVAAEELGEEFLKLVSLRWTRSRIVAISSIGYCGSGQLKLGSTASDSYPGMRDTRYSNHKVVGGPTRDYEYPKVWNDLGVLPWASERSPHAKVAYRGVLITNRGEPAPVF
jgi:hypothetical protein